MPMCTVTKVDHRHTPALQFIKSQLIPIPKPKKLLGSFLLQLECAMTAGNPSKVDCIGHCSLASDNKPVAEWTLLFCNISDATWLAMVVGQKCRAQGVLVLQHCGCVDSIMRNRAGRKRHLKTYAGEDTGVCKDARPLRISTSRSERETS